jgi:hypothetical protein
VKTLRANLTSSEQKVVKDDESVLPFPLNDLQRAGLKNWALQISEAIKDAPGPRSEDSIDTIVPLEWQLYLVLLSCKNFLVGLSKSVPCASMDNEHIKDRKNSEDELRNKMK